MDFKSVAADMWWSKRSGETDGERAEAESIKAETSSPKLRGETS